MRFLAIKLLLVLTITSCSLKTTEGLRNTELKKASIVNPYFSNHDTDYVYKAKIDVYGRYFGGILVIKKLNDNSHRVVFTTEFGSKLFDFLFEGDTFTKIFILEDLDKKLVVNTLRKDFKLLISEDVEVTEQFTSEMMKAYKSENYNRYNFYFFGKVDGSLKRIVSTSKYKEKVEIVFTAKDDIAETIAINHQNIKLNIDLEYLKKD